MTARFDCTKTTASFWQGSLVALVLAVLAAIGLPGLTLLIGGWAAFKITAIGIAGVYATHLITSSGTRSAKLITWTVWAVVAALIYLFAASAMIVLVGLMTLTWIIRVVYHRRTFIDSVLDLGLFGLGAAISLGALLNTGSIFLGVWTFFLIQALHCAIPRFDRSPHPRGNHHDRRFNQALRSAEAAVRRIHQQPTV